MKKLIFSTVILFIFSVGYVSACDNCSPTRCPSPTPRPTSCPANTPTPTPVVGEPTPTPTKTAENPTPTIKPEDPTNTPAPSNNGGSGGGVGGGSNSSAGSYSCSDPAPNAPKITSVLRRSATEIEVFWNKVNDPVSYYGISYGPNSKNYLYGQSNIGNVTNYKVGSLESNKNYCFTVNAVNNCASSPFSEEVCSTFNTGSVLGLKIAVAKPTKTPAKPSVKGLSKTSSSAMEYFLFNTLGLLCVLSGTLLLKPWKKSTI